MQRCQNIYSFHFGSVYNHTRVSLDFTIQPHAYGHAFWTRHPTRYVARFWNFTPFELQVNFTQKMLALPYQKYTFSERKFDEEFKYGFENEVGWGTNILWLKLFRFCGPQNQIFLRAISLFPIIRFISPQHIWIPHQISFQKIYNYMILLIFIM